MLRSEEYDAENLFKGCWGTAELILLPVRHDRSGGGREHGAGSKTAFQAAPVASLDWACRLSC